MVWVGLAASFILVGSLKLVLIQMMLLLLLVVSLQDQSQFVDLEFLDNGV